MRASAARFWKTTPALPGALALILASALAAHSSCPPACLCLGRRGFPQRLLLQTPMQCPLRSESDQSATLPRARYSITSSARANREGGISRPKIRRGSIAIPGGVPSSPRIVVPASELFLLKRLARLLRGRIEVKDLVVGAGSDPGSGRHVAVAAEGDAAVVETDRQAIAARQFVDRDTAAVTIDHAVCGLFPKAIAAGRQRACCRGALAKRRNCTKCGAGF